MAKYAKEFERQIAEIKQNVPYLKEVCFIKENLTTQDLQQLNEAFRTNHTVTTLRIHENVLNDQGAAYIAGIFQRNSFLTHIELSRNSMSQNDVLVIAKSLETKRNLISFSLFESSITLEIAQAMAAILENNHSLTHFTLAGSKLDTADIHALSGGLANNLALKYLKLSGNEISDTDVISIITALKENSVLCELDLSRNQIGDEAAKEIALMLAENCTLTTLKLTNNQIGVAGITTIATVLAKNSTLKTLHIKNNQFDLPVRIVVQGFLSRNNLLATDFDWSNREALQQALGNDPELIDSFLLGHQVLQQLLENNSTLVDLDIAHADKLLQKQLEINHYCALVQKERIEEQIKTVLKIWQFCPEIILSYLPRELLYEIFSFLDPEFSPHTFGKSNLPSNRLATARAYYKLQLPPPIDPAVVELFKHLFSNVISTTPTTALFSSSAIIKSLTESWLEMRTTQSSQFFSPPPLTVESLAASLVAAWPTDVTHPGASIPSSDNDHQISQHRPS